MTGYRRGGLHDQVSDGSGGQLCHRSGPLVAGTRIGCCICTASGNAHAVARLTNITVHYIR
ncbi:hypothetical protein UO65_1098 [Actinokineospora spheciospongiae]|uniref:Uncharacterized protein n=1 Tax=Actinokineospora spheciospongiae TaxID=909613 RepID=W7J382_9PSEU|nr:hypothetical protein UO65_1098 [Actinokineospora spheciospongiae]